MREPLGPKECAVCGKTFMPRRHDQMSCGDPVCVRRYKNRKETRTKRIYIKRDPEPVRIPKPDTIVAIGYAERQMAETLKMVGKVKV